MKKDSQRSMTLVVAAVAGLLAACSDDGGTGPVNTGPGAAVISSDITANRTLFKDTVYTLSGFIHVANGATLTIQAGTKIVGDPAVLGSSLFVLRGARIIANGTAQAPIVFTSGRPEGARQPGDWGGLIIVGNGLINRTGNIEVEGTNTNTQNYQVLYSGGTNNGDNSGSLSYVRVEFAGFAPSDGNELNSFTFAAVGSGTQLDHLQAVNGLDDSFEWFGGAVDAKYLVSYNAGDDHFDMSEGYSGRLQFLIAYQDTVLVPRAGAGSIATDPQGIENDGCNTSSAGCASQAATPLTQPVVANFTLVGRGNAATSSSAGDIGMVLRRGTGGYYVNGVLSRWARAAISVRDAATQTLVANGGLTINNVLITEAPALYQVGHQVGVDATANALVASSAATSSLFSGLPAAVTTTAQLDWAPASGSAIASGGMTTFTGNLQARAGAFVTPTAYRGAADPNGAKWWAGWTTYSKN